MLFRLTYTLIIAAAISLGSASHAEEFLVCTNSFSAINQTVSDLAGGPELSPLSRLGRQILHRLSGDDIPAFIGLTPSVRLLDEQYPNAFLNGHQILITSGLSELLQSEDELAFVIAHEMGHLALHSPIDADAHRLAFSGNLQDSEQSQRREFEADEYAMRLLRQAGYQTSVAKDLFRRLMDANKLGDSLLVSALQMNLKRRVAKL